jgi:hypothetical protein
MNLIRLMIATAMAMNVYSNSLMAQEVGPIDVPMDIGHVVPPPPPSPPPLIPTDEPTTTPTPEPRPWVPGLVPLTIGPIELCRTLYIEVTDLLKKLADEEKKLAQINESEAAALLLKPKLEAELAQAQKNLDADPTNAALQAIRNEYQLALNSLNATLADAPIKRARVENNIKVYKDLIRKRQLIYDFYFCGPGVVIV